MKWDNIILISAVIIAVLIVGYAWNNANDSTPDAVIGNEASDNPNSEPSQLNLGHMVGELKSIDKSKSTFEFEGFAPAKVKSHIGTFDDWSGSLTIDSGNVVSLEGIIQADSVNTGIAGLDNDLISDNFFDVEKYPTISFISSSVESGQITGRLSLHGVTETISFPAEITSNSVSAEFDLDTTPFNIKYVAIQKEVRIKFYFVV